VVNVNNNCSTGSSALFLARRFVQGGLAGCVALGFEKMERGSLGVKFADRTSPTDKHFADMKARRGIAKAPPAAQMFGNAGREYMERYGISAETFARIGEKNHRHSANNPYAQFQEEYTLRDITGAAMTLVAAMELKRYGVRANCIAPVARTRLTLQTPGMSDVMARSVLDPENVSPLVACLATADCPFSGQVFSVYGRLLRRSGHLPGQVSTVSRSASASRRAAAAGSRSRSASRCRADHLPDAQASPQTRPPGPEACTSPWV